MNEPQNRKSRVLRGLTTTDIIYGVIGLILLVSSTVKVIDSDANSIVVITLIASALLVGSALRAWTDTK